jgi:hypothetical protein
MFIIMKSCFRVILFAFILASTGLFVSCEPDDTTGTDPDDPRNDYVGVWHFTELNKKKDGLNQSYIVTITLDPNNSSQVLLDNFCNPGNSDNTAVGTVTTNQVVVSSQPLSNGWTVAGSGKLSGADKMNWNYSMIIGGDIEYHTAEAIKQ